MLEDTWHVDFPRRPDVPDGYYPGTSNPLQMWDNYPYMSNQQKKEENIGLTLAISKSILSTGRIHLQRKLFCSMQLVPQSRISLSFVAWRGGAILGVINYG